MNALGVHNPIHNFFGIIWNESTTIPRLLDTVQLLTTLTVSKAKVYSELKVASSAECRRG